MNTGRIIEQNLLKQAQDEGGLLATCLPEERCKVCGRELLAPPSYLKKRKSVCASCSPRSQFKAKCIISIGRNCNLRTDDPGFNEHSYKFYHAFERAIARGDFR